MGTITFNDIENNVNGVAYYDASVPSYAIRGSQLNVYNVDLFPDTGVSIGDAVIFALDRNKAGKSNLLRMNLSEGISGNGIAGVWEYCVGGTNAIPEWAALDVIADNTNGLTAIGEQTLSFNVPVDWDNFHLSSVSSNVSYSFLLRYRITAITTWTTGGHFANISNSLKSRGCTINCIGFTSGDPLTMAAIKAAHDAGGWGVLTAIENQYSFACNLYIDSTSTFVSKKESIQFENNWFLFGSGVFLLGEIVSGDKVRSGSKFSFNGKNCNYPSSSMTGPNSSIYNSAFQVIPSAINSAGFNGPWGNIAAQPGTSVYGLYVESFRQLSMSNTNNVYMGVTGGGTSYADCHVEHPGAVMIDISIYGGAFCVRPGTQAPFYIHRSDFSAATTAPINPYWSDNYAAGHKSFYVDCDWGNFADSAKAIWNISQTPKLTNIDHQVWQVYSFQGRVVDSVGLSVDAVKAVLKNADGTTHFSISTNPDGYISPDFGTATAGSTTTLNDTAKAWAADEYFYKEVLLTGGIGAGQRRVIKKGGTANELPFAWPCSVAPAAGTRYAIVPYINARALSPIALTPSSQQWSVLSVENNPFTLVLRKYGMRYQSITTNINKPVDTSYVMTVNPFVTADEATAGAYTGIAIDPVALSVTITEAHTMQEVYDYSQWWAAQSANMTHPEPITTVDGANFNLPDDWDLVIDASVVNAAGKALVLGGTGVYSIINGGDFDGVLQDATYTRVKITAPNLVDDTRVYVINDTLGVEVDNSVVSGGNGYVFVADIPSASLVAGNTIMLFATYCVGLAAKRELSATGILTNAGLQIIDSQEDWQEYIDIGIDGSTVTEFSADYPTIEVNIADPDNVTTKQRLIAWWVHNLTTADGIRYFFEGITLEDVVNYRITAGFNLYLDNVRANPLKFTDGARLYKANGETVIASASNSIQLDSGKVYSPKVDELLTLDDYLALRN